MADAMIGAIQCTLLNEHHAKKNSEIGNMIEPASPIHIRASGTPFPPFSATRLR